MYNLTVTKSNFASNNASNIGNAITGSCTMVNINDNYWGSASPDWTKEIKGIPNPTTYSKTKINHQNDLLSHSDLFFFEKFI